jgi:hypothetical protein
LKSTITVTSMRRCDESYTDLSSSREKVLIWMV